MKETKLKEVSFVVKHRKGTRHEGMSMPRMKHHKRMVPIGKY